MRPCQPQKTPTGALTGVRGNCFSSLFFKIELLLIYNVVLVSGIQQSDSVICVYMHLPRWHNGLRIHLPMQETQETQFQSLDREDPPKYEMATHCSILAWEIPWTEEPTGLPRVGHN